MPSSLHEAIIELFRNRPVLAAEVLDRCLHMDLPEFKKAGLAPGDVPKLKPAERRADAVVILRDKHDQPALAVVVEVQLKEDTRKRRSWPDYLTGLFSRHECPATLLVVCPGQRTAAWAGEPIAIGHPGFVLRPLVLGPDLVPLITDTDEAIFDPELAVLSGIAHGRDKAVRDAAFTAVAAVKAQDFDLGSLYAEVIVAELPRALRKIAEEEMRSRTIEFKSEAVKAMHAEAKAEAKATGEAILAILAARDVEVTPAQRTQIMESRSLNKLNEWLLRAVTARSADDVFA